MSDSKVLARRVMRSYEELMDELEAEGRDDLFKKAEDTYGDVDDVVGAVVQQTNE